MMKKENLTEIEKITGVVLTEEVKQRILNDCRNPIKDWALLNADNPVKLLYFTRVLMSLVLETSTDQAAIALAKLFNALDHSTNLMHAWESVFIHNKQTTNELIPLFHDVKIRTDLIPSTKEIPTLKETAVKEFVSGKEAFENTFTVVEKNK